MVIQHNLSAGNTERQMGIVKGNKAKSTQRLSSGYRINCAADDAAGLSISEKMRKQIRGLTQGITNAEDGISLCQVADGAMTEVHDMLQRMNELAVKAANGTNSSGDREAIDMEVSALIKEIDRIGETTKFNDLYILKDEGNTKTVIGGSTGNKPSTLGRFFELLGNSVSKTGYMEEHLSMGIVKNNSTLDTLTLAHLLDADNDFVSVHADFSAIESHLQDLVGTQFFVNCCTDDCPKTVKFTDATGISFKKSADVTHDYFSQIEIGMKKADGSYFSNAAEFCKYMVDGIKQEMTNLQKDNYLDGDYYTREHVQFAYSGTTLYVFDIDNNPWGQIDKETAYFCDSEDIFGKDSNSAGSVSNKSIWIQSGAETGDGLTLQLGAISSQSIGIKGMNVLSEDNATDVIDRIADAIGYVSAQRSRIGAQQNRLEHTVKNEQNIVENTTAAESQIRDTDMAQEMVRFSGLNILEQAVTSMLAQANQSNQSVLTLLNA